MPWPPGRLPLARQAARWRRRSTTKPACRWWCASRRSRSRRAWTPGSPGTAGRCARRHARHGLLPPAGRRTGRAAGRTCWEPLDAAAYAQAVGALRGSPPDAESGARAAAGDCLRCRTGVGDPPHRRRCGAGLRAVCARGRAGRAVRHAHPPGARGQGLATRLCARLLAMSASEGACSGLSAGRCRQSRGAVPYTKAWALPTATPTTTGWPPAGATRALQPRPSSIPRCTFIACTAAPLAPLPRLSNRAINMAWARRRRRRGPRGCCRCRPGHRRTRCPAVRRVAQRHDADEALAGVMRRQRALHGLGRGAGSCARCSGTLTARPL